MDDARRGVAAWSRMSAVLLVLFAFVIIPFAIWGDRMDALAPELVQRQDTRWAVALIGIGLLVADVLLPIPSSVISISLCLLLGPWLGGFAVFSGMVGAFAVGFLVGRLLPVAQLRAWVGEQAWDALASRRLHASLLWIGASRPVPVLAEMTAVLAGSSGLPFVPALSIAALSSLLVSIAYGLAGVIGLHQADSSPTLLVFTAACLPAVSWGAFRWIWRSLARS